MAHKHDHLRAKAIQLRTEKQMTLDEITERLSLPKTTIYHWIKDIPLQRDGRSPAQTAAQQKGTAGMQAKYAAIRQDAYRQGWAEAPELMQDLTFRDFVVLYMAEGYRRNRNAVSIANSNSQIIRLSKNWITNLATKKISYRVQIHIDHDEDEIKGYWSTLLGIAPNEVSIMRKSNSGKLAGRQFRSQYGVFTIAVSDTYLRARLEAWMDFIKQQW